MHIRSIVWVVAALSLLAAQVQAQNNWPQWRGPNFNGASDAKNLPDTLDVNKNLAWQAHLPGIGSASPVLFGDRVFVSAWDEQSKKMLGVCLSLKDGHQLWQREIGLGYDQND